MEINPGDLTLEQIKEQLAIYSRLDYHKRRHDKDFMEKKGKRYETSQEKHGR